MDDSDLLTPLLGSGGLFIIIKTMEEPKVDFEKTSVVKGRSSSSFIKIKVFALAFVAMCLDLSGFYSNWSFAVGTLGKLAPEKAIVAVNGTWKQPEYIERERKLYYNLSTTVCNPSEESQVPGLGMKNFLLIWCCIGLGLCSLYYIIAGIAAWYKARSPLVLIWLLQLRTLDEYGGLPEDDFKLAEKYNSNVLFITQDVIFLISFGFYTFSCTPKGTFDDIFSMLQYALAVFNVFKRLGTIMYNAGRENFMRIMMFLFTCPGIIHLGVIIFTIVMIIVPLVRFFQYGSYLKPF